MTVRTSRDYEIYTARDLLDTAREETRLQAIASDCLRAAETARYQHRLETSIDCERWTDTARDEM